MTDFNIPEYVNLLLNKIANSEGFSEHSIAVGAGCEHGDGFLSTILSVTISGIRNNGNDKMHLVCKLAPTSPARRKEFESLLLFKREVLFYEKVLPLFAEFQRGKNLLETEIFNSYPKCFAAIANDDRDQFVIILDDMRPKGYSMWPKHKIIPINYAYQLMEQLGKLHAISFALKDQRPEVYNELKNYQDIICTFIKTDTMVELCDKAYHRALGVLDDPKHIEIVRKLRASNQSSFEECLLPLANEQFCVISHGDCWINNMLFKCSERAPIEMCFIDWQMSRMGPLAADLHYIMSTSSDKEFRRSEYKNLMVHYHQALSNSIRRFGSDPDTLIPFDQFQLHLKKFGKYAFLQGLQIIQLLVADSKNIANLDNISEGSVESKSFIQGFDDVTQQKYAIRIRDFLTDFIELGYWN